MTTFDILRVIGVAIFLMASAGVFLANIKLGAARDHLFKMMHYDIKTTALHEKAINKRKKDR